MSKLEELVFQALGEASMCWSERPKGVFDSDHAKEVGHKLVAAIKDQQSHALTLSPARMKNLQITSRCPSCGKVKGYSGMLMMGGSSDDEEAVEVPETCMCGMWRSQ